MAKAAGKSRAAAKSRSTATASASATARKPAAKKKVAAPAAAPRSISTSGGTSYAVTCSECYSEFRFRSGAGAKRITCPECLHLGEVGQSDAMAQIAQVKKGEQGAMLLALVPGIVMTILGFVYIWLVSRTDSPPIDAGLNYGLLGGLAVLLIVTIALSVKYENNRYEVYF
ncbi:MAG: hypothetical protein ACKVX7_01920 [Planctomycetota bacterium]